MAKGPAPDEIRSGRPRLLLERLLLRDSRGKPSWTVSLAVPSVLAIMAQWAAGGLTLPLGSHLLVVPSVPAADAALLLGLWLAFFGEREYTEKTRQGTGVATEAA